MLTDKIALVTGAGRGIGKAIAVELAANGAYVIVNYNGSVKAAEDTVSEIVAAGGKAEAMQCDVSDFEACGEMIKAIVEKHGHVDILVNNAGITRDGLLMKMSEEDFDCVLGKIINLSSVSGILGNAGQANYSASKAGVIGLTKSVARELASRGIHVNAVAPGFVTTDMTDVLSDRAKEEILAQIPLQRAGTVKDIAKAVLFLASEDSDYITGQVLSVDGGMAI